MSDRGETAALLPTHNHGSEEGDGLACHEYGLDGRLYGACVIKEALRLAAAVEVVDAPPSVDAVPCDSEIITAFPRLAEWCIEQMQGEDRANQRKNEVWKLLRELLELRARPPAPPAAPSQAEDDAALDAGEIARTVNRSRRPDAMQDTGEKK